MEIKIYLLLPHHLHLYHLQLLPHHQVIRHLLGLQHEPQPRHQPEWQQLQWQVHSVILTLWYLSVLTQQIVQYHEQHFYWGVSCKQCKISFYYDFINHLTKDCPEGIETEIFFWRTIIGETFAVFTLISWSSNLHPNLALPLSYNVKSSLSGNFASLLIFHACLACDIFQETLIKFAKRQDGLIADSSLCQCNECKKRFIMTSFKR